MSAQNDTCNLGPSYWRHFEILSQIVYHIMPPFHIILGVSGHSLSLLAFYRQSKSEKAYAYQIYCTISDLIYLLSMDLLIYGLINWITGRTQWFVTSYAAMWFAGRVIMPLMQTAATNALLASLCMALDRVYALARPIQYQMSSRHGRIQIAAFSLCFLVSFLTSFFECYRYRVQFDETDGTYSIPYDLEFMSSRFASALSNVRNVIRSLGLIALIVCNCALIWIHKKQTHKVFTVSRDPQKEKERKLREKSLLILTVTQSACTFVSVCAEMSYLYLLFTMPGWFLACGYQDAAAAYLDGIIEVANVFQFYTGLAINKPFRRVMKKMLFKCGSGNTNSTSVAVVANHRRSTIDVGPPMGERRFSVRH